MGGTITMQIGWQGGLYEITACHSRRYVRVNWYFDIMKATVFSSDALDFNGDLADPIDSVQAPIREVKRFDQATSVDGKQCHL